MKMTCHRISSLPWSISPNPIFPKFYPFQFTCRAHPPAQFVVPEGVSPLHLLHILVLEGVLTMSDHTYLQFVNLQMRTTWNEDESPLFSQTDFDSATIIFQQMDPSLHIKNTKMILMGSELGAGGSNDILMLLLLHQLHEWGLPFEVLLSASSVQHIWHAERRYSHHPDSQVLLDCYRESEESEVDTREVKESQSLYSCLESVWKTPKLQKDVHFLFSVYRQHLCLASYCKTAGKGVIISNRVLSKAIVADMTAHLLGQQDECVSLNTLFDERTFAEMVVEMNHLFRRCVQEAQWHKRLFEAKERNPLLEFLQSGVSTIESRVKSALISHSPPIYALSGSSTAFAQQETFGLSLAAIAKRSHGGIENCVAEFFSIEKSHPILTVPPSQPGRRYFSNVVQTLEANLDNYPTVLQRRPKITVTGDTHANPLLKIFILITKQVIWMEESDYRDLKLLFEEFASKDLTLEKSEDLVARLDSRLEAVCHLCAGAKGTLVIVDGDDLADRGPNDLINLIFYRWLDKHGVRVEVPISNHGFEHIRHAVKGYQIAPQERFCLWMLDHSKYALSLVNMIAFVNASPKVKQLANELFEAYRSKIRVISYVVREKTALDEEDCITLIYHAPVGERTFIALVNEINEILQEKGLPLIAFKRRTMQELIDSIDALNTAFSLHLGELVERANKNGANSSLNHLIWARHAADRFKIKIEGAEHFAFDGIFGENAMDKNYQVHVIHGHTNNGSVFPELADRTINLEGALGRPDCPRGLLRTVDWD